MYSVSSMRRPTRQLVVSLIATLFAAGCGLDKQSAPSLIGPSEFGLSVTMRASPDQLPRDGTSQSRITLTVHEQGLPPRESKTFSLGFIGTPPDGVRLSQSEVTVAAGAESAAFAVTAPTQGAVGNQIVVAATPVGGNFDTAVTRTVTIAVTGTSNATAPVPAFTVTPTSPEVNQDTTFDASGTTDEGVTCGSACGYSWNFGDGSTATGQVVTKRFTSATIFTVVLTVTDSAGTVGTLRQFVTVIQPAAPTVTLSVSPTSPVAGQQATITATATPATNHNVVRYDWTFGDGTTQSTTSRSVTKTYSVAGTYTITVTAVDDLGQSGSASASLTVTTGISVVITASPTNPRIGQTVRFDGSGSTTASGATITSYTWDFGNGLTASSSSPVATTTYATANTFTVRLTVVDSQGRTATSTVTIAVTAT